jgi:hypothetical protein
MHIQEEEKEETRGAYRSSGRLNGNSEQTAFDTGLRHMRDLPPSRANTGACVPLTEVR